MQTATRLPLIIREMTWLTVPAALTVTIVRNVIVVFEYATVGFAATMMAFIAGTA